MWIIGCVQPHCRGQLELGGCLYRALEIGRHCPGDYNTVDVLYIDASDVDRFLLHDVDNVTVLYFILNIYTAFFMGATLSRGVEDAIQCGWGFTSCLFVHARRYYYGYRDGENRVITWMGSGVKTGGNGVMLEEWLRVDPIVFGAVPNLMRGGISLWADVDASDSVEESTQGFLSVVWVGTSWSIRRFLERGGGRFRDFYSIGIMWL
jgi:hypothetical protein